MKAMPIYEETNMYGGAHRTNYNEANRAMQEGRDIIVHRSHYDGQRYTESKYRVTNLHQVDGNIVGTDENGNDWKATKDICEYAKNGQL